MARISVKSIYYAAKKGAQRGMRSASRYSKRFRRRRRYSGGRRRSKNTLIWWLLGIGAAVGVVFLFWPKIKTFLGIK